MASITLTGTLLDPTGEVAVGDQIRFTHRTTTGETLQFARSVLIIPPSGMYNFTLEFGLIFVEHLDAKDVNYKSLGVVTVNGDTTATDLPGLLNAIVPPTDAQLLLFQGILQDTEDARDIALAAAAQQTALELIFSTVIHPAGTILTLSGFALPGDDGAAKWELNGTVGQQASQSPAQLDDALINDGNGNQWAFVDGSASVVMLALGFVLFEDVGDLVVIDTIDNFTILIIARDYANNKSKDMVIPSGYNYINSAADGGSDAPDLTGPNLIFSPGAVLSVEDIALVDHKEWKISKGFNLEIRARDTIYYIEPNIHNERFFNECLTKKSTVYDYENLDFTAMEGRFLADAGSVGFVVQDDSTTKTANEVFYGPDTVASGHSGLFTNPVVGKYFEVTIEGTSDLSSAAVAIILQCGTEAFRMTLPTNAPEANIEARFAHTGTSNTFPDVPLPARNYGWSSLSTCSMGVRISTLNKFDFFVNGLHIKTLETDQEIMACFGVGFVVNSNAILTGNTITFHNPLIGSMDEPTKGTHIDVAFIGDSITFGAGNATPYPDLVTGMLKGCGYGGVTINNTFAAPGETAAEQDVVVQANDFSGFDFTVILIGTNDISEQTDLTAFEASVSSIISNLISDGTIPILCIPTIYTDIQITGGGMNTSNFTNGGIYRSILKRLAAAASVTIADTMAEFGDVSTRLDNLFDNLHPNFSGSKHLARAVAKAIIHNDSPVKSSIFESITVGGKLIEVRDDVPFSGYYRIGDEIKLRTPIFDVSAVTVGYMRMTEGFGQIVGTDWKELIFA